MLNVKGNSMSKRSFQTLAHVNVSVVGMMLGGVLGFGVTVGRRVGAWLIVGIGVTVGSGDGAVVGSLDGKFVQMAEGLWETEGTGDSVGPSVPWVGENDSVGRSVGGSDGSGVGPTYGLQFPNPSLIEVKTTSPAWRHLLRRLKNDGTNLSRSTTVAS